MYVRNLSGTEYVLQATATWQSEISGNLTLSLTVLPTKANNAFIRDIAEMWVITDDNDVAHKVVYAKRQGVGDMLTVDIKAVPLFYDDFDNLRIYTEYNQHMTAMAAFTLIFADTGYNFVLHGAHDAISWEGFGGGESRLETFKRAIDRYGAEFEISGNTVHLKPLIGRDTQFQYRHRLNASNIVQEIDASGFWTYAKGYGDYGESSGGSGDDGDNDWQDAKLIREYTSPLAQIPGIGLRHAPPIKDGRVKIVSAMDKSLKTHVDESLKVSVTTDIHDLRKQGYALAQPQLGDRVFLTDERIGFDEEVRVVAMSITKDWRGNVTHFSITIGDEGVTKRHMSNLTTAIDNITSLIEGKMKLPNSVLDNAILQATKALQNAQTELTFGSNGILAIDKVDPNYVTILNSKGVGVSIDGGATFGEAITGRGINASYIVAGVLDAGQVLIRGGSSTRYIHIDESTLTSRGTFARTWGGETETADLQLGLYNGHIRVNNLDTGFNLYMTEKGLSTTMAGASAISAGTIEFHSQRYNTVSRGVTMHSTYGTVAMVSDHSTAIIDANRSINLNSTNSNIYIRPTTATIGGTNEFIFRVKDNSWENSDGWISFGDVNTATYHSGLRFSKYSNTYTIYATNGNGDIGTGHLDADTIKGTLVPRGTNNYLRAPLTRFVRPGTSTTNYADIQFAHAMANTIRVNDGGANFYIGTSSGEVRITDNNLSSGTYRPIKAARYLLPNGDNAFPVGTLSTFSMKPTENEGSDSVKGIELLRYTDKGKAAFKISGDDIAIDEVVASLVKSNQEMSERLDSLEVI